MIDGRKNKLVTGIFSCTATVALTLGLLGVDATRALAETAGADGIQVAEDAVGCDKVRIAPHAVAGVTWAKGHLDTPKGRILVSWRLENGRIKVEKQLPAGIVEL